MKIGDLVKVYNFSRRAREKFGGTDVYMVGLIISDTTMYRNWSIQLCKHNITYIFQEDRLEVIA
jgi:hypothetical protein